MIVSLPDGVRRISLRRVDALGRASDVVGHLVAVNDQFLVVLPEDRPEVWVPRAEVRQTRSVPERRVLPASPPDAVQRILDLAWPGERRGRLGGWVLRASSGTSRRANSVLVAGDPGVPWEEAVQEADHWVGGTAVLQVVDGDPLVGEPGFVREADTIVMVADATTGEVPTGWVVGDAPSAEWLALWRDDPVDAGTLAELTAGPAKYLSAPGIGAGRVAVVRDWAVVSCVHVREGRRREGWGGALTRALTHLGAVDGARHVALQVEADNPAARALYGSLGFEEHHRYCYLRRPAS